MNKKYAYLEGCWQCQAYSERKMEKEEKKKRGEDLFAKQLEETSCISKKDGQFCVYVKAPWSTCARL